MLGTTRYANLMIDTADRLATARTPEQAWHSAAEICRTIGAQALNAGAVMRDSREFVWARSTMARPWLREYEEAALYRVDPFRAAAVTGKVTRHVSVEDQFPGQDEPQLRHLRSLGLAHNYRHVVSHLYRQGATEQMVVLICEQDPASLFGPGTLRAYSAISAMISQAIRPPGLGDAEDRSFGLAWPTLTSEERSALSYCGVGMAPDQIAERLVVTQEGASSVLRRACRKLRVDSVPQAVAIAMARGALDL